MMTDEPRRITPAEICDLLSAARTLPLDASPPQRLAYFEHKAELLTRVAAYLDTAAAHEVAAEAWDQAAQMARELRTGTEAQP
jgi:hypothetical protein